MFSDKKAGPKAIDVLIHARRTPTPFLHRIDLRRVRPGTRVVTLVREELPDPSEIVRTSTQSLFNAAEMARHAQGEMDMKEVLLRLVYISTATSLIDAELMNSVLKASTFNNSKAGVTGVLCSGANQFLQVLEGSERKVLSLYARLADDPRHRDMALLSVDLTEERLFPGWSMAKVSGPKNVYADLLCLRRLEADKSPAANLIRDAMVELKRRA